MTLYAITDTAPEGDRLSNASEKGEQHPGQGNGAEDPDCHGSPEGSHPEAHQDCKRDCAPAAVAAGVSDVVEADDPGKEDPDE